MHLVKFSRSPTVTSNLLYQIAINISRRTLANMPKADSPTGLKHLRESALFAPLQLGPIQLEHRIVQAPLTRMRATKESEGVTVPNDLNVEYFGQRASKGGLQLTEATDIAKFVSCTSISLHTTSELTTFRLVATLALPVYLRTPRLQVGRRSQIPCTQRADISFANCGTQAVRHHLRSVADNNPLAQVTSLWRVVGRMALCVQSTRRVR